MKICIIHSIFPPYTRGGAEQVAFATASAFAEAGHEVTVITCALFEGGKNFAGKWEESVQTPSNSPSERGRNDTVSPPARVGVRGGGSTIRIFRFTPLNLFTIFNIGKYPALLRIFWHVIDMFNVHTYLVVKKILTREKPDLIITRNLKGLGYTVPLAIQSVIASAAKQSRDRHRPTAVGLRDDVRGAKWFHGLHDLGSLHPRGFMEWGDEDAIRKPIILVRLYRACARYLFGSPDVVIAPSQFVLDEYERAGFFPKSKKVVIGNPVGHNPSQPPLTLRGGDAIDSPLRVRGDRGVTKFVYIGQLEPYKGLRVLLAAWKEFIVRHPNATLEIVGKGSLEEEVRRTAQSLAGIVYRGFVPHKELPKIFKGVCATIMPSLAYETFGMAAAESLAVGVPVIASRIGALPEIVRNNVDGILVNPGDVAALKDAMERIIQKSFIITTLPFAAPAQYRDALETLAAI